MRLDAIAAEIAEELQRVLAWWSRHAVDHAHGGFHGEIDAENRVIPGAPKGAVLNARILWFFSETARVLHDPRARVLADRAAGHFVTTFVDHESGGVIWEADAHGRPANRRKQGYAHAFAIYALVAHHRATGDSASLSLARELFELIETRFLDAAGDGYLEARAENWSPIADMRLSESDANCPKTMNTHLHVLEAYSALHAAAPSEASAAGLNRALLLMLDRFVDAETHHLRLFFEDDWTDRTEAASFGHDIEASWLLCEAAEALGDDAIIVRARAAALDLARACVREALDADGGVHSERTFDGRLDARRVWWVQAEAMVGFLNAYELSRDDAFLDAFARVWAFIKRHHRDEEHGEWSWWSALDAPSADRGYKAGFWKGPYHNGRALMQCGARLKRMLETP